MSIQVNPDIAQIAWVCWTQGYCTGVPQEQDEEEATEEDWRKTHAVDAHRELDLQELLHNGAGGGGWWPHRVLCLRNSQ